jgi:hypothetical protein
MIGTRPKNSQRKQQKNSRKQPKSQARQRTISVRSWIATCGSELQEIAEGLKRTKVEVQTDASRSRQVQCWW